MLIVRTIRRSEKAIVESGNERRTRILMLSWEFPPRIVGGIARHVAELSRALAEMGLEVDVVTSHHPGAAELEELALSDGAEGRLRVLRAGPPPVNPLDFVCEIHQLGFALVERLLRDGPGHYDLVHAHDWLVGFPGRTVKHGLGVPLVATIHATEAGRQQGIHTPMQGYIQSVEWLLTYEAWKVICCSQAMLSEVAQSLRTPPDKLQVVPNGVDPERLDSRASPEELAAFRRKWAGEDERIVLFVGRLVREKGAHVLIEALPEVLAAHPEVKVVVAGGGWWGHLAARAAELGVRDKVVFAGFVPDEDLARLYAVADVAAFPSLYEPFGIVAIEAMAAGIPAVVSDVGGFREVVRHEETGIHTWANNPQSLAWGLGRVLSEAELAERLGRNGREEVRKRFAWREIAARTLEVYRAVWKEAAEGERGEGPIHYPGVRPRYLTAEHWMRVS